MTATSGPGFFAEAGEPRIRGHDGNAMRDCKCHARGTIYRYAYAAGTRRCNAGTLGNARGSSNYRTDTASVGEIYSETIRAFNLSEQLRVPVIVLFDEIIGHLLETIDLAPPDPQAIVKRNGQRVTARNSSRLHTPKT